MPISREMLTFERRIHLVSWAVRALYTAVAAFITDALIRCRSQKFEKK
jgi:hypothetical protein